MASTSDEDIVVLELTDPSAVHRQFIQDEILISTSDTDSWDLDLILRSKIVRVQTNRSRLINESSYFRGLLDGSFSESNCRHVSIQWNVEAILSVLQFIGSCSSNVTANKFLPLLEGALFLGVNDLFLKCETWFRYITSGKRPQSWQMQLDTILEVWKFGWEHEISFVREVCEGYLSQNFAWAISCSTFAEIPYDLLSSCIEHPQLTVECEKQLCEALLLWLANNTESCECSSISSSTDCFDILNKVRKYILPLGYAAGLRRHFLPFADETVNAIMSLIKDSSASLMEAVRDDNTDNFIIRLTKYSEKIVLSGCAHLTAPFLFLAVLPRDMDIIVKARIVHALINFDSNTGDHYQVLEKSLNILPFECVHEVDISKCHKFHFGAAIIWLHLAFPSLRVLKASHCPDVTMEDLVYLVKKCPLIHEVDLTVDASLVAPTTTVLYAAAEGYKHSDGKRYKKLKEMISLSNIGKHPLGSTGIANISKLTLEGRNDVNDSDLIYISSLFDSLSYLNIKGCTLVTDVGISKLICKCRKIHSLNLSNSSFGKCSILTLCSSHTFLDDLDGVRHSHKYADMMAFRLQELHIDGCKGVDQSSMSQLMCHVYMLKTLSLRETCLVDDALVEFMGSSLESLDVSETMVTIQSLTYVIKRNPHLRCLKATSCRNLQKCGQNNLTDATGSEGFCCELGRKCILEELALGWGFSLFQLEMMKPAISNLRLITVGLGASVDHQTLYVLPELCPLLESVVLIFQVISDTIMRNILESLKHLQVLCLRCCLGDLTLDSFQISMPNLRTLRLEWVTPWLTNAALVILTQNCPNLVELSLSGCKLLDARSQEIISSGWPGLTSIYLENCGKVTSDGVSFLFNCKAVEDLLLRHNGQGIPRDFISDAASKLPLLRKVALDLCDACDGGFNTPAHAERFYMHDVRISRCTSHKCGIELQATQTFQPVHKETIVLEWTSTELRTTLVKERL